jgi:cation:H+ antiporter
LYFDTTKNDPPNTFQVLAQTVVGIGMLIGAAELFVSSIEHLAHGLGTDTLILTLVIAPLATELPEKINSVLWIRQGNDTWPWATSPAPWSSRPCRWSPSAWYSPTGG